ncbi:MAG: SsrA-binding protein SmpB [Salinivirgaceae bacterium]|jgi:SsrA-binding protein|nr:SsrA-binding protein SmpB [Salinivirgaceae bacterium]
MKQNIPSIKIRNKKAYFRYNILETFTAGIQLMGLDIKLIRSGKVSISESYCNFFGNELYVNNLHLAERESDRVVVHKNKTERKLLLNRRELNKLQKRVDEKGLSIVPLKMYFNDRGLIKLEIALVKGKREYDKRNTIKQAESNRELDRLSKQSINKYK